MKIHLITARRFRAGFTLVELLTVIAIIGILAAMLLPVLAAARKHALIMKAKTEINDLVTDIQAYDQDYGKFPVSHAAQIQANQNAQSRGALSPDFTYGGPFQTPNNPLPQMVGTQVGSGVLSNNEVVSILMDITNFPGNPTEFTINTNNQSNPKQTKYLNAKMSGWQAAQGGTPLGGIDNDLVFRDPWGNPYIISMDLNYDDLCEDSFYCNKNISWNGTGTTGYNGLNSPGFGYGTQNNFAFHGKVMVWSAGPDKQVDPSGTSTAVQGVNKDNILSWQ